MQKQVRPPRWAIFIFALALLFETWIWNRLNAALRAFVALIPWTQLKARIAAVIDLLPAPAALLLFVIPLVFVEAMSFFSVVLFATGHFILGAAAYLGIKILGFVNQAGAEIARWIDGVAGGTAEGQANRPHQQADECGREAFVEAWLADRDLAWAVDLIPNLSNMETSP